MVFKILVNRSENSVFFFFGCRFETVQIFPHWNMVVIGVCIYGVKIMLKAVKIPVGNWFFIGVPWKIGVVPYAVKC